MSSQRVPDEVEGNTSDPYGLVSCPESEYGAEWKEHLLEQYKLYVEMADRISARRMLANTFFLTLNSGILAALAFLFKERVAGAALWAIPPFAALLVLCYVWWKLIRSYRQLNTAKFDKVVPAMEKHLPADPYVAEWKALGLGKDPKLYTPLTAIEHWVPRVFMFLYVALALICFFAPIPDRKEGTAGDGEGQAERVNSFETPA